MLRGQNLLQGQCRPPLPGANASSVSWPWAVAVLGSEQHFLCTILHPLSLTSQSKCDCGNQFWTGFEQIMQIEREKVETVPDFIFLGSKITEDSDCSLEIKGASGEFSSVAQSYLTLCDPMDCSTPGFPVHHQLSEFTQTHVH